MARTDKVAVVTGAGSGIGRGVARRLAKDGIAIAAWDLNGEGAQETVDMIAGEGGRAIAVTVDCADKPAIQAAAAKTRAELGPITILVNNAGISPYASFDELDDDLFDRTIRVNLRGPYLVTKEIYGDMLAAGWGRIINITSSSVQSGAANLVHYVSSKGGLLGMTKALAMELGGTGITVNMIPPGSIDTPMLRGAPIDGDAYGRSLPVKRLGLPEDIGAAAAYLASEEASYMTGQTISTNGGRYMGSA